MKRLLICLLMFLLFPALALPEGVVLSHDLTGVLLYPYDASLDNATYVYRYTYPQFAGDSDTIKMMNETYLYEVSYAEEFTVPMEGEMLGEGSMQYSSELSYRITCATDEYLCVLLTTECMQGMSASTRVVGHTFALTGAKAGRIISLPYLLGALDAVEQDPWLQDRQTAKCDACIRGMIWEQIEEGRASGKLACYDDLDRETFELWFWPEEDFYLEQDGTVVFYVQEAAIAPQSEGVLEFRFTMEEILDEL